MTLGQRIRSLRKEKEITQAQLGEKVGVSDRTIGYYETDERYPPPDILGNLANFFNVSVDFLLGRKEESTNVMKQLEEELPEGLHILRRATKELDEASKRTMIRLMKAFVDEEKKKIQ